MIFPSIRILGTKLGKQIKSNLDHKSPIISQVMENAPTEMPFLSKLRVEREGKELRATLEKRERRTREYPYKAQHPTNFFLVSLSKMRSL